MFLEEVNFHASGDKITSNWLSVEPGYCLIPHGMVSYLFLLKHLVLVATGGRILDNYGLLV